MSCVYVLKNEPGKCYIGSSREGTPDSRLRAHNAGKTKSTKAGRPWKLIYVENFSDYTQARKRENFLKTGVGRKQLREILNSQHEQNIMEESHSGLVRLS